MKKGVSQKIFSAVLTVTMAMQFVPNITMEADSSAGQADVQILSDVAGFTADSLTLQPGETTASINLNWYAPEGTKSAKVRVGEKLVDAEVSELHTPTVVDESKYKDTGKMVCKATLTGLVEDTVYYYQVSNDGGESWSEVYAYKTPDSESFSFAFTSDPQIKENGEQNGKKPEDADGGWDPNPANNQTGWAKMMEVVSAQGVSLMVSAGDQVEDQSWGKTSEYDAFFAPEEMRSIAYAPAVGNHDRHYMFEDHFNLPNQMIVEEDGKDGSDTTLKQVKTSFRGQNNGTSLSHGNYTKATESEIANASNTNGVTPNALGFYDYTERREMETLGNYYYLYNNILFVTLNTSAYPGGNDEENAENAQVSSALNDNSEAEAIVENFRKTLTMATTEYKEKYDWIVVTHHKSTQTVAKHAADSDIENYVDAGFEELMDDFDVDFVLGGHDHVYSRSYALEGGKRVEERLNNYNDPKGTIYITGNCCSDMQYYTPFQTLDKTNNADYPVLANGLSGSAAYMEGSLPYGNQEWNQEYSPSYVIFEVEDNKISAKAYNLSGDSNEPDSKLIDSFTITKNASEEESVKGFENGKDNLNLSEIGRFNSNMTNADGGVMEIVAYNDKTGWAYAVNGQAGVLTAIELKELESSDNIQALNGNDISIKKLVEEQDKDFSYGDMTSVSVSDDGSILAAAIQNSDYAKDGKIALFNCNEDGTLTLKKLFTVGVQPDMVTFTPDGKTILSANEGEPRNGYEGESVDPEGSVSVIDVEKETVKTVGFESFDHDSLVANGIVLKKNTTPAKDLEPEYIACTDSTAYVSLQEANAIAVLDLATNSFTGIYSVGFEDFSKVALDLDKGDEKYDPKTYDGLFGIRMPDGISITTIDGTDYLLTANEGDSRDWEGYCNEKEAKKKAASPAGNIPADTISGKVVYFDTTDYDGLKSDKDYLFGGRSFTLFKVTKNGLEEVFDSGNDFEANTYKYLPEYFNCSNDDLSIDDRSGKKGPEAESVTVGNVDGKTYAFVTLERIGGIMVYDITNPDKANYVNYINSRDFSQDLGVDDSPEGLCFISAKDSPTGNALLLAACEVGGTVAAYELTTEAEEPTPTAPSETVAPTPTAPAETIVPTPTAPSETIAPTPTAPSETVAPTQTAPSENAKYGDANVDGKVDLKDATIVLKAALGIVELEGQAAVNADADKSNKINLEDANLVLKAALGILDL